MAEKQEQTVGQVVSKTSTGERTGEEEREVQLTENFLENLPGRIEEGGPVETSYLTMGAITESNEKKEGPRENPLVDDGVSESKSRETNGSQKDGDDDVSLSNF